MNNFLNNTKQKIILCRILEIVYAENSEQFLWENSEHILLNAKKDFVNAVSRFEYIVNMMYREQNFVNEEIDFINVEKQIHSF